MSESRIPPAGGCAIAIMIAGGVMIGAIAGVVGTKYGSDIVHRAWRNSNSTPLPNGSSSPSASAKAGVQLWTCGMHPQVIQDHPGECPICHMQLTPVKTSGQVAATAAAATAPIGPTERKIKHWWDPMMNPPYISDHPGKSPMGMDLVPVYEDEAQQAGTEVVIIDPTVVQNMGVRTAPAMQAPLHRSIRAVGYLDEAQPNIRDVNLLVSGWIRQLHVNAEGMRVQQGDPLFELYSPDLQVAIEELIAARRTLSSLSADADEATRQAPQSLLDATARKLNLWGLPKEQIDGLAKLDHAPDIITFVSPITGDVTEKPIVEGSAVKAGDRVLRIVDHSTLWLDVKVYEKDLALVHDGQAVNVSVASQPGKSFTGSIMFITPHVDMPTRAATARVVVDNSALTMRPGMYAVARIESEIAESPSSVVVPREAIIDTGERQVTFVAQGIGRFEPRIVVMGQSGDDGLVEVMQGLSPGETVVISGQFLIDSESRIREAIQKFVAGKGGAPAPHEMDSNHDASRSNVTPLEATSQQQLDAVVMAYLGIARSLGATQTSELPLDPEPLMSATHALRTSLGAQHDNGVEASLATAADGLAGKSLEQQREQFKTVSAAILNLVAKHRPSPTIAERLFVIHCPMAPGDWLQTTPDIANPYYATSMKECGEVVRTISTSGEPQP